MRRILAILLLALPLVASAGEDGGTVSVFAYGVGGRTLGMGGAGCADDAAAELFLANPGALGGVSRPEFQAGHASLYGLGINEEYAFLVWPDWRWGVLGIGARHLGVGDIDARDAFNVPLASELSSTDQQLTLSYGKTVGSDWQLGASLNLRRQELAGHSGGGLGLDLGAQFLPAALFGANEGPLRGLRCGLAIRNLVQPSIRLDQDSVRDPTALRLGLAQRVLLRGLPLHIAGDVEKIEERSARLHAGLELRIDLLALRVGYGYERLAAGAGLSWRDLRLDYVFEDNPLEAVHRLSLSFRFGQDVRQRRAAALAAADAALQERMEEAFREQQERRLEELLGEARDARDAGRSEEALRLLGTVLALEPSNPTAVALAARCHCDIAERSEAEGDLSAAALSYQQALSLIPDHPLMVQGLERVLAESDRRAQRGEVLRARYAAALDAFSAGHLNAARAGFQSVLATEPGDRDAAEMLRRTEATIANRLASLLDQAGRFGKRGFFDEADALVGQAAELAPGDRRIAQLERELGDGRRAERRRQAAAAAQPSPEVGVESTPGPAAAPPRALGESERKELADLYRRGMAAAEAGRRDDALRYWELVWSRRPGYQQVDSHLKREYLMRGMELFASGRLEEAASLWEKALQVDPEDQRAMGYLARAREQLARTEEIFKR